MSWQFHIGQKADVRHQASSLARPEWEDPSPAGPHVDVFYASEPERDELFSRLRRAGLGDLPRLLIEVESEPGWGLTFTAASCVTGSDDETRDLCSM